MELKDKHSIRVISRAIHFIEQFCKEDTGLKEHIESELAGLLLNIPEEQPSAPVSVDERQLQSILIDLETGAIDKYAAFDLIQTLFAQFASQPQKMINEEIELSMTHIFENTKRIHGNSESIDWIKVAIHRSAEYLTHASQSQSKQEYHRLASQVTDEEIEASIMIRGEMADYVTGYIAGAKAMRDNKIK